VQRINNGLTTTYVYDAFSNLAAEYSSGGVAPSPTRYFTADHLGSVRVVTKGTGCVPVPPPASYTDCVYARYDYTPFGDLIPATMSGSSVGARQRLAEYGDTSQGARLEFTGKERDSETNLSYFGERYYSSSQGRFTSPDRPFVDQSANDPRSWNLYGYVRNNPLRFVDPTGAGVLENLFVDLKAAVAANRIAKARRAAVQHAWEQEKKILKLGGQGTRAWSQDEINLLTGKTGNLKWGQGVPGYDGHHINNVASNNASMARNPDNIHFLTEAEHANVHRLGATTSGPLLDREGIIKSLGGTLVKKVTTLESLLMLAYGIFLEPSVIGIVEAGAEQAADKAQEFQDKVKEGNGPLDGNRAFEMIESTEPRYDVTNQCQTGYPVAGQCP
jgi:RHS repeat-associated protein